MTCAFCSLLKEDLPDPPEPVDGFLLDVSIAPRNRALVIERLSFDDPDALSKLLGMGALPGVSIRVVAARPAFMIEIHGRRYALDEHLARRIYVKTALPPAPINDSSRLTSERHFE